MFGGHISSYTVFFRRKMSLLSFIILYFNALRVSIGTLLESRCVQLLFLKSPEQKFRSGQKFHIIDFVVFMFLSV